MTSLEEQFQKSEKQRQETEILKKHQREGLPTTVIEKFLELTERLEFAEEFKRLNAAIDLRKLAEELHASNMQMRQQALQIEQQETEVGQLRTQIQLLSGKIGAVDAKLDDLVKRIGSNPEKQAEVLDKLNRYLDDWV